MIVVEGTETYPSSRPAQFIVNSILHEGGRGRGRGGPQDSARGTRARLLAALARRWCPLVRLAS